MYVGVGETKGNPIRDGLERLALQKGERDLRECRAVRGLQGEWYDQACVSDILGRGGSRQGCQKTFPEPQVRTGTATGGRRKVAGSEIQGGSSTCGFGMARRWNVGKGKEMQMRPGLLAFRFPKKIWTRGVGRR